MKVVFMFYCDCDNCVRNNEVESFVYVLVIFVIAMLLDFVTGSNCVRIILEMRSDLVHLIL